MLSKEQLGNLAQPLVNLYTNLEKEMLINIAKRLANKKNLLAEDPEVWMLHQLQQLGMLDKDNLTAIRIMAGLTSAQLNQLLYDASLEGLNVTEGALAKAIKAGAYLKVPPPISESPQITKILAAYASQALNILNLVNQTMLIKSKQVFTDILNKVVLDVLSGSKTHDQALRDAIRLWSEQGIPALVDKAGRKWGVEGYVRTVIISTTNNTINAMQDERFKEWGVDLIEVSSHSGARPLCAPYQGKIFRINGTNPKYPDFKTTSYGQPAGLFGINCGHRKYPFIQGVSTQRYFPYDDKQNEKVYKESQQQRAIERAIRKAKNQYEMYKAIDDKEGMKNASSLIKDRQSKMRDFIDETGRKRRNYREQIHTNKPFVPNELGLTFPKIPKKQTKTTGDVKIPKTDMKPTINPNVPVINTDKPEDYKVKHKEIIYKTPDGVLKQKNEVYAIKGTGKNTEEILLGNIKQNAVLKSTKKSKMVYNTSDGYIAIDKDGNTIGVYKTQKAAKQYMLDKYLAEKGIIQKAKEPMKVTPGSQTKTPDPINPVVEPPKEVKLKLMDEVTFNLNGKDVTGKILDIDKKTGLLDIIHDKQVYEIHKDKVIKTEATKVEPLKKPTSKKPATKPITAKKPADDKQLPNPNVGQIDFDSYRKLESFDQDIHRDSFTISKMNSKDKSWIRKYTSNFYSKMNTYLRRNKTDKDDVFEAIDNLRRVLNVNAKGLSQDTVFFRKIGRESIRHIFSQEISDVLHEASNGDSQAIEKAKKMLIGGAMEDKAFMSTTYKYGSFGSSMDLDIEIYSPKGYKGGMFVESISEYSDEKEYVFNSGKKFDIVDLVIDGRKTILRLIPTN